jgi:hypothetical protein
MFFSSSKTNAGSWASVKKKQLPEIHLGDFGEAVEDPNHNFNLPGDDDQSETESHWSTDIYGLGYILRNMVVARENGDMASVGWQRHFPASYFAQLRHWVNTLDQPISQLSNALNLVQNLLPIAQQHVAPLFLQKNTDGSSGSKWLSRRISQSATSPFCSISNMLSIL